MFDLQCELCRPLNMIARNYSCSFKKIEQDYFNAICISGWINKTNCFCNIMGDKLLLNFGAKFV